jgi:signal transduction histidine kinase
VGFDRGATGYGTGLQGIADRLGALDGELEVASRPGSGTSVHGRVPVGAVRRDDDGEGNA